MKEEADKEVKVNGIALVGDSLRFRFARFNVSGTTFTQVTIPSINFWRLLSFFLFLSFFIDFTAEAESIDRRNPL